MAILTDALTYTLAAMIANAGQQIQLVKRTTLPGANPAPNPPLYENLVADGAFLNGTGSINFRATLLTGRLIAGDQFVIAGDPTTYTVTGQVISPTTTDALTNVPFTPALAQNVANGAAVMIIPSAVYSLSALLAHFRPDIFAAGTNILETDEQVRFLKRSLPSGIIPVAGDIVLLSGGEKRNIVTVKPVGIRDAVYAYYLHVRT